MSLKIKKGDNDASVEVTPVEKITTSEEAIKAIQKKYGKGTIFKISDSPDVGKVDIIPSGSLLLNKALGIGGYPKGRIIEIYGPEMSGKTTMALQAIAEAQKKNSAAAFIDAEHSFDPGLASGIGVDVNALYLSQPDYGEQALDIMEMLVTSGSFGIVVIDSVSALVPKAELDGEMGDSHMGLQARLMSQAMRKLTGITSKSNTCVIFINQIRMKIGVIYGSPETTSGGNSLKFYASVRIDVRKTGQIKKGVDIIGNEIKIKVIKNKLAPPYKEVETSLIFGKGINKNLEIVRLAVEKNIIEKAGPWYSYGEERLGQGEDNAIETLEKRPEMLTKLMTDLSLS